MVSISFTEICMKTFASCLAELLTKIFQYSLDKSLLPFIWKPARVVPIYKERSKHLLANYRPVSLTSVYCKMLEHVVQSIISKHLEKLGILAGGQHGLGQGGRVRHSLYSLSTN